MPRGRGWSGIIANGPAPSWSRDERWRRGVELFHAEERAKRRLARQRPEARATERKAGPAITSAAPARRTPTEAECLRHDGWATDGDRELFSSIAVGRPLPRLSYLERALWRNRKHLRDLAKAQEWARRLVIFIPSRPPA